MSTTDSKMIFRVILFLSLKECLVFSLTPSIEIYEPASRRVDFHLNQRGTLICKVNDRQGYQVRWFHKANGSESASELSRDLYVHVPGRYSMDKPSSRSKLWRLTIKNIRSADAGEYSCRIFLSTQGSIMEVLTATVVQAPVIDSSSSTPTVTLQEGEFAELRCVTYGLPPPIVVWSRSGGKTLSGGGASRIGSSLTLEHVQAADRGVYTCRARNRAGEAQRKIHVGVLFEPVLSSERMVYRQARGYDRELSCYVEANPMVTEAQVVWSRNGQTLHNSDRYVTTFLQGALDKVTWKLYIKKVRSSDYGEYTCAAYNGADNTGNTISISVQLEESSEFVAGVGQVISSAPALTGLLPMLLLLLSATGVATFLL